MKLRVRKPRDLTRTLLTIKHALNMFILPSLLGKTRVNGLQLGSFAQISEGVLALKILASKTPKKYSRAGLPIFRIREYYSRIIFANLLLRVGVVFAKILASIFASCILEIQFLAHFGHFH